MNFEQEIEIYFRSRFTLICVVSFEEERILQQLKEVCERSKRPSTPGITPTSFSR